ncbi:hypothetical protein FQA39_LY05671 [Lamprigera yunnana]|nr:hypothetical protein FQA39_LY05671 [Lamprigera yunnana]
MAKIALITITHEASRICFPLCMLSQVIAKLGTEEIQKDFYNTITAGRGGFVAYNMVSDDEWYMQGTASLESMAQIIFHCIFETYIEDFFILEQSTNIGGWYTRKEMGKSFEKLTTCGVVKDVKLPKFQIYSKITYSNRMGLLATQTTGQRLVCPRPVFSGYDIQHFNSSCISKRSVTSGPVKTIQGITDHLLQVLESLRENAGKQSMWTTSWYTIGNATFAKDGTKEEIGLDANGKYFLEQREF